MRWRYWHFGAILAVFSLLSCGGNDKVLTARFQMSSGSPDLIVIVGLGPTGQVRDDFDESINFGTNPSALLACGKYLGWLPADTDSGSLPSAYDSCTSVSSSSLSSTLTTLLPNSLQAGAIPSVYSTNPMTLPDANDGYVFIISFFDLTQAVGSRCFHLAAAKVDNRKFIHPTTSAVSEQLSFTSSNTAFSGSSEDPLTNQNKCFRF